MDNPSNTAVNAPQTLPSQPPKRRGAARIILYILAFLMLSCGAVAATTAWWVKRNVYASPMTPVKLSANEQQALDAKLQVLQSPPAAATATPEEQARTLTITQKEINAYLAGQNLGDTVNVELGNGRVSATMIVPVPADSGVPLVAGTTLRVKMTLETAMDANKKLSIKLTDVRLGGISLPNAWLGDLKGVNLVAENIEQDPGLQRFLAGIQEMEVRPDGLRVLLNE